jgi:hypothetical protein
LECGLYMPFELCAKKAGVAVIVLI